MKFPFVPLSIRFIVIFSLFWSSIHQSATDFPKLFEHHAFKLSEKSNSIHRSNVIKGMGNIASRVTGEGVKVMIRDEGTIGPHIDFKGRVTNLISRSGGPDHHEDLIAGCIAGAGNLDPTISGMAPHALLFAVTYTDHFSGLDTTLGMHKYQNVMISNSSYGDLTAPCNGDYNQFASTVDKQLFENPSLMHVFAGGNEGNEDCGYVRGFGNMAGGHLIAKNAIAVGSVSPLSVVSWFSSRGPGKDKRLKPDLVAMGEDYNTTFPPNTYDVAVGTSFAAPAVAGIMAQLYQAYKELHSGINPPSALIKALMCNTAEDLGNPGPDYKHGFGLVHAGRAYESLKNQQYLSDSLQVSATHTHNLQIPAGISEARIMLYWPDKEGMPGAAKTLITDLDVSLTDTANQTYLPLVLDPTPNLTNLNRNAQPGIDTLNNIEQIVLKNPQAGSYQIHVDGTSMPVGKTGYYLSWFFFKDELQVTFPYGGEAFAPQEDVIIRWDAYSDTGTFDVDYSLNNGRNWTSIATGVNGALRYQLWQTPAQISGQARIRVTRGTQTSESQQNFTIIESPDNLQFARVCQDFVSLTWDAVTGATSYDVFVLGEKYMDSVGSTSNTFFEPKIRYQNENWFSVRARGDSGIVGRRAIAVKQNPGILLNCAGVAPTALFSVDTVICDSQFVFLRDHSLKSPDNWSWSVSPAQGVSYIQNTSNSSRHPILSFVDTGTYQISLQVASQFGMDSSTQTVLIKSCNTPIENDFGKTAISVFPNPNNGVFRLKIEGKAPATYQIELIDLQGKSVHRFQLTSSGNRVDQTFDFSHLVAGIYFMRIDDGRQRQVVKVVKK